MIREYDPADHDEVLGVWYDAARIAHPFWTNDRFEQERRDISQQFLPVAETWVFEKEGRVVGFIALLDREVGGIFVAPSQQGQGVGRALMNHACASRDHLELDVFEKNNIGRAFYDAYGFVVVGDRMDDRTGQRVLRLQFDCGGTP